MSQTCLHIFDSTQLYVPNSTPHLFSWHVSFCRFSYGYFGSMGLLQDYLLRVSGSLFDSWRSTKYPLKLFPGPNKGCISYSLDLVFKLKLCHNGTTLDLEDGAISFTISKLFIIAPNSAYKHFVSPKLTSFSIALSNTVSCNQLPFSSFCLCNT